MNVASKVREAIKTATITPETRSLLDVMAMFNEANQAFFEWMEAFYDIGGDEAKEDFAVAFEDLYFRLETALCLSISTNMNKLPFEGI